MVKGFFIDSVHQMVTGGVVNDSNSVWREDIAALLPAAVNMAVVGGLWDQSNQEHDRDIPSSFIGTFENLTVDTTGNHPKFTLPKTIIPLSSDRGIRLVTTVKGDNVYTKMNDNMYASWNYYKNIFFERFYKLEGTDILLFNKPALETGVTLKMIVSTEDYTDDQHLPVPAGKEMMVIDELYKRFIAQRYGPADRIEDQKDVN